MEDELTLTGVTRTIGGRTVLDDVGFTVRPGRGTGLVGSPDAGCSTVVRVVMGLLAPDAGTITLGGRPITRTDRRRFGYVPQRSALFPRMPVLEQLEFLAQVHGVRPAVARARADALIDRLDLGDVAGDPLQSLPPGDQQRVQVVAALVHEPAVVVLDEPFAGFAPGGPDVVIELLRERVAAGAGLLLASHVPGLVTQVCDDVVVLDEGRVIATGGVDELSELTKRTGHAALTGDAGPVVSSSDPSDTEGAS